MSIGLYLPGRRANAGHCLRLDWIIREGTPPSRPIHRSQALLSTFPVLSETFTLSLLTAVLLKGILEIVVVAKNRVKGRFRAASTPIGKAVAGVMLWLVLFGSKFLVLEAVHLVFGYRVSLGGFFSVTLLILVLLLSRTAVRRLLRRPFLIPPRRASG